MSTQSCVPSRTARYYQITVEGKIDPSWSDWLGGLRLLAWQESGGRHMTTLSGMLADAALRAVDPQDLTWCCTSPARQPVKASKFGKE
jgi:hypothetical protein